MKQQLRELAQNLIDECYKADEDVFKVIKDTMKQWENENFKTQDDDISKEMYFMIAEEIVRTEHFQRKKLTKPGILNDGIEILYIVHQKKYNDENEFCAIVAKTLGLKEINVRRSVLCNFYSGMRAGLSVFLYIFQTKGEKEWHDSEVAGRLRLLERCERNLY